MRSTMPETIDTRGPAGIPFTWSIEPAADGARPAEYPLALVEWHDAWFDLDQDGPDDCRHDYVVRTVGFLVAQGPRSVSLAQEILPDGEGLRAVTHIPLPIVERIVRLDLAHADHGRPQPPPIGSG